MSVVDEWKVIVLPSFDFVTSNSHKNKLFKGAPLNEKATVKRTNLKAVPVLDEFNCVKMAGLFT